MINHDCVPNARIVFDQEGHLTLKAKKTISQGEAITITYVPALLNTPARLSKLKNSKFFVCKCQLCCDPTENGTFLSALVCPKCQVVMVTGTVWIIFGIGFRYYFAMSRTPGKSQWARKLKKSRQKKLLKSNKLISRNFIYNHNGQKSIFELTRKN